MDLQRCVFRRSFILHFTCAVYRHLKQLEALPSLNILPGNMQRALAFFWFFVTWVGANNLRHRHLMINEEEPLLSHESPHHPENSLALRHELTSTGEKCTICWEAMKAADVEKIVVCSYSNGKHGFHFDCLKNNIHLRHTKCPLCGDGVQLPVSESDLRTIYLNRINELMKTVEHYSTFEISHATDVLKDPIKSDMTNLIENMKFKSAQIDYLEEHHPAELKNLRLAYRAMLRSLELTFRRLYLVDTNQFLAELYQEFSEKHVTFLDVRMRLQAKLRDSFEVYSNIQRLWWHNLNVVWLGTALLNSYTANFHVKVPSKKLSQNLMHLLDTSDDYITDVMLFEFTQMYRNYKKGSVYLQRECKNWNHLIPDELRNLLYLRSAFGKYCDEEKEKYQRMHEQLPIFADRVIKRCMEAYEMAKTPAASTSTANALDIFTNINHFSDTKICVDSACSTASSTQRSFLHRKTVANFMEELPRQSFPVFNSLYHTFQEFFRSSKKRKFEEASDEFPDDSIPK